MTMDLNRLVRAHLKIRDARTKLSREFDDADSALKAKQDRLEAEMLRFLNDNNTKSVRTESGTVYRAEDIRPVNTDWDTLYAWIKENDTFEALERRLKKTFVQDYMEEHNGAVPPGVSVARSFVARVRRN